MSHNNRKRVLLISNSTLYGSGYLDHAESEILDFLASAKEGSHVLKGSSGERIFRKGHEPVETKPGEKLDHLFG